MKEATYIIALGSNLPSAFEQLAQARRLMQELLGGFWRYSRAVSTAPMGNVGTHEFANQVAVCTTPRSRQQVETTLKGIERRLGRNATDSRRGVIHLDLDLLCSDGVVLRPDDWERPYIREALCELQ